MAAFTLEWEWAIRKTETHMSGEWTVTCTSTNTCNSVSSSSLLANSRVEHCRTDDLMPNVPISCLPPSHVDHEVEGLKSSLIVLSQVVLGRPTGLLQSAGGLSAAAMTRWWSSSGAVWARCPKKLSRSDLTQPVTGEQAVMLRTVSLIVCLVYGICQIFCRHQLSKASRRLVSVLVMAHVSHPYSRTGRLVVNKSCNSVAIKNLVKTVKYLEYLAKVYSTIPVNAIHSCWCQNSIIS